MQEAYDMAIDALGLILTDDINDHKELPEPSNITHVDDGVVVIIPYDYLNLNFSQILQDALLNKIQSR